MRLFGNAILWLLVIVAGAQSALAQIDFAKIAEQAVPTPRLRAPVLDSLHIMQQARRDMDTLCSDFMAGRGYTHEGHLRAASWLKEQFQRMGLRPLCNNSYLQSFAMPVNVVKDAKLQVENQPLKLGEVFIPSGASAACRLQKLPTLYLGYADTVTLSAPKLRGKAIIMDANPPSGYTGNTKDLYSRINSLVAKAPVAAIVVREGKKLTATMRTEPLAVPIVHVLAEALPQPQKAKHIHIEVQAKAQQVQTQNVIAYIPGSTSPDSLIILSAHYDHLGQIGSSIFRGASDNASGVAFILAAARALSKPEVQLPYSVAFIAFGGEEVGLFGSIYYSLFSPCHPLAQTKYVLNFDMMANGEEGVMAVAGKTYPEIYERLQTHKEQLGITLPLSARENRPNSDHYPFTTKGVPALFFYTMGGPPHYHDIYDVPDAYSLVAFQPFLQLILQKILQARQ